MRSLAQLLCSKFSRTPYPNNKKLSTTVQLAVLGVSIGIAVIIVSVFIVDGFKLEIREKINRFTGDIRIFHPDNAYDQYTHPLTVPPSLLNKLTLTLDSLSSQNKITPFADQVGILKSASNNLGISLHGVNQYYDKEFYREYLTQGELPRLDSLDTSSLLISKKNAQQLQIAPGDTVTAYFLVEGKTKIRKLILRGTFETGYKDYDESLGLTNLSTIQLVNGWERDEYSGLQVNLSSYTHTQQAYNCLYSLLYDESKNGSTFMMYTAQDIAPLMFGWLDLLDTNIQLILALVICIAASIMVTGIIVLILQKSHSVAILKTLGIRNTQLKKTFRLLSSTILLKGILWGNIIAFILGFLQKHFHIIRLDPQQYYMSTMPIHIDWLTVCKINLIIFASLYLIMFIPMLVIAEIKPLKILRFE